MEIECIFFQKAQSEIFEMIKSGAPIDLKNTYIKGFDIKELDGYKDYEITSFSANGSIWDGGTCFSGMQFKDCEIDFSESEFVGGDVDFSKSVYLNCDINFMDAIFEKGSVHFSDCDFDNTRLVFQDSTFEGVMASFNRCSINTGEVIFAQSYFEDSMLSFFNATFGDGPIHFHYATIKQNEISFEQCTFGKGDLVFEGANFESINFKDAKFGLGELDFTRAKATKVFFKNNIFYSHVNMQMERISELIVENCTIEKTFRCDHFEGNYMKYNRLSFYETINLGQIFIDFSKNNVQGAIDSHKIEVASYDREKRNFTSREKESQFYMLKENYRKLGHYDDAQISFLVVF